MIFAFVDGGIIALRNKLIRLTYADLTVLLTGPMFFLLIRFTIFLTETLGCLTLEFCLSGSCLSVFVSAKE